MIPKRPLVKQIIPEKKENTKLTKLLEAIEKGKANLIGTQEKKDCSPTTAKISSRIRPHSSLSKTLRMCLSKKK